MLTEWGESQKMAIVKYLWMNTQFKTNFVMISGVFVSSGFSQGVSFRLYIIAIWVSFMFGTFKFSTIKSNISCLSKCQQTTFVGCWWSLRVLLLERFFNRSWPDSFYPFLFVLVRLSIQRHDITFDPGFHLKY